MLKVKPDVIIRFHELNRLHNIGLLVIRSLYQKRHQSKKIKSSGSSPLFETPTIECRVNGESVNLIEGQGEQSEDFVNLINDSPNINIEDVFRAIDKLFKTNRLHMDLLLKANEPGLSINKIHHDTGINRSYLTKVYQEAVKKIKKELNND